MQIKNLLPVNIKPDIEEYTDHKTRLASSTIYEIVSAEGKEELLRPKTSLAWSAIAAGLCICFSPLSEMYLRMNMGATADTFLVENIGYTFGFIIVVLARLQLFTENTITVILPLFEKSTTNNYKITLNLWTVVFLANLVGTFLMMAFFYYIYAEKTQLDVLLDISRHAIIRPPAEVFFQGIPSGFLIAVMIWMMPSSRGTEIFVVFLMTYIIAIGDFTHVVAGSAEAFLLVMSGDISFTQCWLYIFSAGAGNIIGGTGLFSMLAYAQVKDEMPNVKDTITGDKKDKHPDAMVLKDHKHGADEG